MLQSIGRLGFQGISRTSGAITLRVASLYHEIRDDPVERKTVVESLVRQGYRFSTVSGAFSLSSAILMVPKPST
jgi:hypothetical protein